MRGGRRGLHGDVEIEIAVVIIVHPRQADAARFAANADFFSDVFEFSTAIVMENPDSIREADGEIGVAVVVKISGSAPEASHVEVEARFLGDVGEFTAAEIAKEAAAVGFVCSDEKKIWFAVAVVIENARADTRTRWKVICSLVLQDGCVRHLRVVNGNGGRRVLNRAAREFSER